MLAAGETFSVDTSAAGTLSLRALRGLAENLAGPDDVRVVELGAPDREVALSPTPLGFLRGTVPDNVSDGSAHRLSIRNETGVPLAVVRPAIALNGRATPPVSQQSIRPPEEWFLIAPTGTRRTALTLTRLDTRLASVAYVVVGERLLLLEVVGNRVELFDFDTEESQEAPLPEGNRIRIELGETPPACGVGCVGLALGGVADGIFLGDSEAADGASDGVIVEAVDFFDR